MMALTEPHSCQAVLLNVSQPAFQGKQNPDLYLFSNFPGVGIRMCKRKPRARTEEENPGGFVKRKEHVAGDFQGAEDPRKGPQLGLRTALLALPRV